MFESGSIDLTKITSLSSNPTGISAETNVSWDALIFNVSAPILTPSPPSIHFKPILFSAESTKITSNLVVVGFELTSTKSPTERSLVFSNPLLVSVNSRLSRIYLFTLLPFKSFSISILITEKVPKYLLERGGKSFISSSSVYLILLFNKNVRNPL